MDASGNRAYCYSFSQKSKVVVARLMQLVPRGVGFLRMFSATRGHTEIS